MMSDNLNFTIDNDFRGGFEAALVALNNVVLTLKKEGVLTEEHRLRLLDMIVAEGIRLVNAANARALN